MSMAGIVDSSFGRAALTVLAHSLPSPNDSSDKRNPVGPDQIAAPTTSGRLPYGDRFFRRIAAFAGSGSIAMTSAPGKAVRKYADEYPTLAPQSMTSDTSRMPARQRYS